MDPPEDRRDGGSLDETVQRRLADPAFSSLVSQRRRDRFGQVSAQLLTAEDTALQVLIGALGSDDDKVSLQAANLVLTHGHRYNQAFDDNETERRFEELEGRIEAELADREVNGGGAPSTKAGS
jgi:hypothetical protein